MKKLYRPTNGKISGVCKGISKYFNIDESIISISHYYHILIYVDDNSIRKI